MQIKTWLQRLTDESNSWFSAVKAEDDGDFLAAASNYVEDSTRCLEQNLVRSALSCTCAANCLMQLGAQTHARKLYSLAARIYLDNSGVAMSESIRETLWSMQEALENFVLAGERKEAESVRAKYVALSARTNPFGRTSITVPSIEEQKTLLVPKSPINSIPAELPKSLLNQIDRLIKSHQKLLVPADKFDPGYVLRSIYSDGGSRLSEKSIAS